jgi:putative transposase
MLFQNDLFSFKDTTYRLLEVDALTDRAWAICMTDPKALPIQVSWRDISGKANINTKCGAEADRSKLNAAQLLRAERKEIVTGKQIKAATKRMSIIQPLIENIPEIFVPEQRGQLIRERAQELKCAPKTIYSHLRRYWQGGQCEAALYGNTNMCGFHLLQGKCKVRGAKPKNRHYTKYACGPEDDKKMDDAIDKYLGDERISLHRTFTDMLDEHYSYTGRDGKPKRKPPGQRPTERQYRRYFKNKFKLDQALRMRLGEKKFALTSRGTTGSVMQATGSAGHVYEIDATIVDIWLVASKKGKRRRIIGKATLYLVIDRFSQLIVGFYLGLETPSWTSAMLAIESISTDKKQLCEKYDVEYRPEDWPAHQVFPIEFAADQGAEFKGKASRQLPSVIRVGVQNIPGLRPDWKPLVECGFNLLQTNVGADLPGYDPPKNAKARRGKKYFEDAKLTIDALTARFLVEIIYHNNRLLTNYQLTPEQQDAEFYPSPIGIWKHSIAMVSGNRRRYDPDFVRFALLPIEKNVEITQDGISFGGCYYTCPEAIEGGWFSIARVQGMKPLTISHDLRSVDYIYIHIDNKPGKFIVATLTPKSQRYAGKTRAEVLIRIKLNAQANANEFGDRDSENGSRRYHAHKAIVMKATKEADEDGPRPKRSMKSRKADIAEDRAEELAQERQGSVRRLNPSGAKPPQKTNAEVHSMDKSKSKPAPKDSEVDPELLRSLELDAIRERILNGA